jgi:hypothetical protein
MHEECAFDQQQQEESSLFWSVSDTLYSIDHYGIKVYLDALWNSMSVSDKQYIKAYFENAK